LLLLTAVSIDSTLDCDENTSSLLKYMSVIDVVALIN
ncbi:unnamed protein product, partial [marine sediment metagenome]